MQNTLGRIERELKFRLTRSEYQRLSLLLTSLDGQVRKLSTTYFDTTDARLKAKGAALRLRTSGKKHSLELKMAASENKMSALRVHEELEVRIPSQKAQALRSRKLDPLTLRNSVARRTVDLFPPGSGIKVVPLGTMETHRTHVELEALHLDLDRVSIGKTQFYELEIETEEEEPALEWVESVFERLEVKIRPSRVAKVARVWAAWKKRRKTPALKKKRPTKK